MTYDPYWLREKIRDRLPERMELKLKSMRNDPLSYLDGINDVLDILSELTGIDFSKLR